MGNTLLMLAIRRPLYRDISKNLAILLETVRFLIKEGANLNIQEAVSHKLMHTCMRGFCAILYRLEKLLSFLLLKWKDYHMQKP